ncbi:MAG: zinc-binding dehydrogenase [Paracoccaceae bacterium]
MRDSLAQLVNWHSEGALRPHISHLLPFEQAEYGIDLLRTRKSTGKVVINVDPALT